MPSIEMELVEVLHLYARAGFHVNQISADCEFKPLLEELKGPYKFVPNYANAQEHVPEAERNIRVIKERFRAIFHRSPFKTLPRSVIKYLVMECARKLNFFPAKGGCSSYYSPREIMHHVKLNYKLHCSVPTLSHVLAHEEPKPTNTARARALDCLYLRSTDNAQGGHEVYHIPTRQVLTRAYVTVVPITQTVIDTVNKIGYSEGVKNLKITDRKGQVMFDSASIAGVDGDDDDDNDDDDADEEEDEEEPPELETRDESDPNDIYDDADPIQPESTPETTELDDDAAGNDEHDNNEQVDDDEQEQDEQSEQPQQPELRRSGRATRQTKNYEPSMTGKSYGQSHAQVPSKRESMEYSSREARVLATIMCQFNERMSRKVTKHGDQFVVTYSLKKGIQKFGERGRASAFKEVKQLHDRECFRPIHRNSMNETEKKRALESLIFLTEKRDSTIKARHCANGSTQRQYMNREDVTSPTVSTESTMLTAVIDAMEHRDVATCDIPNAFVQTEVEERDGDGNRLIMKIRGACVDILCKINPLYREYVVEEQGQSVLYVHLTRPFMDFWLVQCFFTANAWQL